MMIIGMRTFLAPDQTLTPHPKEKDAPAPPYCPPLSLYSVIKEEIADHSSSLGTVIAQEQEPLPYLP